MTAQGKNAFGDELWLGPVGGVLVKVAELTSIEPPVMSRDTQDATTHDSAGGAMELVPEGPYDPGEIKAKGLYIAKSAGDLAMRAAFLAGVMQDYKIVMKGAGAVTADLTGSCCITNYGPDALEVKGLQTFSITMKASGESDLV